MDIKDYRINIYQLLLEAGETNFQNSFKNFIAGLEKQENTSVYRKILSIYCGAGSFNNLVLYKDGVLCMKENNKLEWLRNGLYNKITEKWN
jgi:hypothetical protein